MTALLIVSVIATPRYVFFMGDLLVEKITRVSGVKRRRLNPSRAAQKRVEFDPIKAFETLWDTLAREAQRQREVEIIYLPGCRGECPDCGQPITMRSDTYRMLQHKVGCPQRTP